MLTLLKYSSIQLLNTNEDYFKEVIAVFTKKVNEKGEISLRLFP